MRHPAKLSNILVFTNQKQPLKCIRQISYLGLRYTLYIIWQGLHLLVKLLAGRTNKQTSKMKSQSQTFLKVLKSARKLYCRTFIIAERLPMSASALKHDHDIIIIKNVSNTFDIKKHRVYLKIQWACRMDRRYFELL